MLPTTPGLGVSVALHGDTAFVIDSVQGQVRQLDPRTLAPTGEPVALPKRHHRRAASTARARCGSRVPTEGTVVGIAPGAETAPAPRCCRP